MLRSYQMHKWIFSWGTSHLRTFFPFGGTIRNKWVLWNFLVLVGGWLSVQGRFGPVLIWSTFSSSRDDLFLGHGIKSWLLEITENLRLHQGSIGRRKNQDELIISFADIHFYLSWVGYYFSGISGSDSKYMFNFLRTATLFYKVAALFYVPDSIVERF